MEGISQVISYRRILGVFPGSSCPNLDGGGSCESLHVYTCMCGDAGVHALLSLSLSLSLCVCTCACLRVCVCARARACVWVRTDLPLSSGGVSTPPSLPPPAPLVVALPSQPSTSPRLVSNDFPPSYPDSGTHPWGTASPLFRIPPPTSLHRRHPYSGKLVLLRVRREPGGRKEN